MYRNNQPKEGICKGFNVVLITVDTLRADHLSIYGYPGIKDPNITKLAQEGTYCLFTFCSMPRTMPSHASIFTGLRPEQHMVFSNGEKLNNRFLALAEVFKNEKYNTGAFVSSWIVDSRFGLDQGFNYYDDAEFDKRDIKTLPRAERLKKLRRRGDKTTDLAIDWIKKNNTAETPFFIWTHYWDVHQPYDAPEPYGSMYLENLVNIPSDYLNKEKLKYPMLSSYEKRSPHHEELMRRYDGGISYVDTQLGRLMDVVKSLKRKTLVIFTADHGESFEHNIYGEHDLVLYNSALRIPMILWAPGSIPHGRAINFIIESIDIPSTLSYLLGWRDWPGVGKNLWAKSPNSFALANTYYFLEHPSENVDWVIIKNHGARKINKLICRKLQNKENEELKKSFELYEITNDPFETKNIIFSEALISKEMKILWEKFYFSDTWEKYSSDILRDAADFQNWIFYSKGYIKVYKTPKGNVFELISIPSKLNIILNKQPLKENFVLSAEIAAKDNSQTTIFLRAKNNNHHLKIHTADNFSIASRYIKSTEIGKLRPVGKFRLNDNRFHKLMIIGIKYNYKIFIDDIKIGEFNEDKYPISNCYFGFGTRFDKIRIRNVMLMDKIPELDSKINKETKEKLRSLGYIR